MRFASLHYAYVFWLVLGLALLLTWWLRIKKEALSRFASNEVIGKLMSQTTFKRQRIKYIITLIAMVISVFALMRPQWGFQWQQVKRRGMDILIAIDTSKSMLAQDVKPNRLERAKLAVRDLVKRLKGDRVGLIAFSGTAFLQCPLTVDYSGFLLSLNDLSVNSIPRGGTSISSAIEEAISSFKNEQSKSKVLIIITDGEDHEGNPLKQAEIAKKEGIKIFCIGIGTTEGELIQFENEHGSMEFLKDKLGNVVKTRLNEDVLKKIALATGAVYVRSSGAEFGLDLIYQQRLSKMEKREIEEKMQKRFYERFQIPLAIAILLLVIEPFISERDNK